MKLLFFFLIIACSYSLPESFRIIYIIHGDNNYLYHNENGKPVNAAERIVEQARFIGENIKRGEVYIFYQKPAEKFLWFKEDDGEFYYYRNNQLMVQETYSREDANYFQPEASLIKKYSEDDSFLKRDIFLYYGHEIPGPDSTGYHSSYPNKVFGMNIFIKGLDLIIESLNINKFDLVVLSTCRNGNNNFSSALSFYTDYLIASPGDIHLSYMNSDSLVSLTGNFNVPGKLSQQFAESIFKGLVNSTSTEIAINLYNLKEKKVKEFYKEPEFGIKAAEK